MNKILTWIQERHYYERNIQIACVIQKCLSMNKRITLLKKRPKKIIACVIQKWIRMNERITLWNKLKFYMDKRITFKKRCNI